MKPIQLHWIVESTVYKTKKSIVTRWNYDTYTFSVVLSGGAVRVLKAEREGFEPSKRFRRLHAFQACLFSHSSISPYESIFLRSFQLGLSVNRFS